MTIVALIQLLIVFLLLFKLLNNISNESVFIIRNIHYIEVFAKQVFDRTHLSRCNNLTFRDAGLSDFTLFTEHIRKFRITRLDSLSTIFDGNLLVINQHRSYNCNIDFFPAIRNCLITALYICHRSRKFLCILHLKILFHLHSCIMIFFKTSHNTIQMFTLQNSKDICIRIGILGNEAEFAINMRYQILQCLVQLTLGIATLNLDMLSVHIELSTDDCLLQIFLCRGLILGSLILMIADDVLYGFRKLRHITLLHIFTHLHCSFQRLVVRSFRKHNDCLILRLCHKTKFALFDSVCCYRHDAKSHTTGYGTNASGVYHLVKWEVVLSVTVFLCCINISKNHLADTLHDCRCINLSIFVNVSLNILLFICQEIISVTGSSDIVLAKQTVQTATYLFTHCNLIQTNIIRHKDYNVIEVCRNIIYITDKIQELQYIYILLLNTISVICCLLATLNNTTNRTVKECMYGIVEQIERC